MGKRLLTIEDVSAAGAAGKLILHVPAAEYIVTPGAADKAIELGITLADSMDEIKEIKDAETPKQENQPNAIVSAVLAEMKDQLPANISSSELEKLITEVVTGQTSTPAAIDSSPSETASQQTEGSVKHIQSNRIFKDEQSGTPAVDEQVLVANAISSDDDVKMSGGYMEWDNAGFDREMSHSEINILLNGNLVIKEGARTIQVKTGDMVYLPKGVSVRYESSEKVRLACVNCL